MSDTFGIDSCFCLIVNQKFPFRINQSLMIPASRTSSIASRQPSRTKGLVVNQSRRVLHDVNSRLNAINPTGLNKQSNIMTRPRHDENEPEVFKPNHSMKRLGDPNDPQEVHEFDLEIFNFMKSFENKTLPNPNFFEGQTNITPRMRATVIDWLVEVHRKLKMHTDTLYLTVYLMDQYLSHVDLDKTKYQRLGCAALLIASKSEEIYPPSVKELVELADRSFTTIALSRMEASLFQTVSFHVNPILPPMFLKRFLRIVRTDLVLSMLSYFILESSLLDVGFIGVPPSLLAASSICLAMTIQNGPGQWTPFLEANTGYRLEDLAPTIDQLLASVNNCKVSRFPTIRKKYSSVTMGSVSKIAFPENIKLI
ncbi:Cyclin, N-terminal domain containing protein [Tritrichomonas foetus]|uniref:Cyclin, N-terminal domain containing protein n=1 Tax=Tritrichomonas foetus TaxID=1144522 RepID=A0A1J4KCB5_9EUKA|nr:Cyclin, N-terminal domain containing protein [Tritrichomonas foetus]|eukprot:OHT08618.1 Cyclin, N-terminal domain containing protein [Tritrichomonas foetus]